MEARSLVSVVLGAVLVGLFLVGCWFGVFSVCLAPSFLLPSRVQGFPLFGTGHPFLPLCRPARLSLSFMRVPVVPAAPCLWCLVGFGLWCWVCGWFLGLVLGWSLAVTTDTMNFSLLQSIGDCLSTCGCFTCNCEGPLCPLAGVLGLGFVPFALVVLPFATF